MEQQTIETGCCCGISCDDDNRNRRRRCGIGSLVVVRATIVVNCRLAAVNGPGGLYTVQEYRTCRRCYLVRRSCLGAVPNKRRRLDMTCARCGKFFRLRSHANPLTSSWRVHIRPRLCAMHPITGRYRGDSEGERETERETEQQTKICSEFKICWREPKNPVGVLVLGSRQVFWIFAGARAICWCLHRFPPRLSLSPAPRSLNREGSLWMIRIGSSVPYNVSRAWCKIHDTCCGEWIRRLKMRVISRCQDLVHS